MNNIKQIISESVFIALLAEAKTPDEMYRILVSKYGLDIDTQFIKEVLCADPTKKFSYTQWALKAILNDEGEYGDANSTTLTALKEIFAFAKENKDFQLQTFSTVTDAYRGIVEFKGKSEYNVIYEDDKWIIYVPESYAAERYIVHHLYNGATWCTASSNGKYHYNYYTEDGYKLYIFANKETNEIYQYSPMTGEFNDCDNKKVDYPAQLVGGEIYDWFEDQGMDLDQGSFPTDDDIYDGGNYGLRCINDLYMKYTICDDHGHDVENTPILWSPTCIYLENENTITVEGKDDGVTYWQVFDTSNDFEGIAYFDNKIKEPYFWGQSSVFGIGDETFYFVSLDTGEEYLEEGGIEDFVKVGTYILLCDGEHWVAWDYIKKEYCYYNSEYGTSLWECEDEPDYDEKSKCFRYFDGMTEYEYNPEAQIVTCLDEDEEEVESEEEIPSMAEGIKKQFNTILEKLNKNYNPDKLLD